MILWDRKGPKNNIFYVVTKDGLGSVEVNFKTMDHVSITVQYGDKRKHEELYFRYKEIPHMGVLDKAIDMLVELFD